MTLVTHAVQCLMNWLQRLNVKGNLQAAGVSESCVYIHRCKTACKKDIMKPSGKVCNKCLLAAQSTMPPTQVFRLCFVMSTLRLFSKIFKGDTSAKRARV